jgi:hypothetical protein
MVTRIFSGEEPFYKSVRFYVSVLTPIVAALVAAYSDSIPWLESLDQAALNTWLAGLVLTAVSFVFGRTFRNVDISGGLAKQREKSTALPGRVVGLEVVKADPSQEDGGGPKELFYTSTRFWAGVLTPIVAAALGALAQALPEAGSLDPSTVATVIGAAFAAGIGYIIARSARNTKLATG